jgi:hypothetical protein
MCTEEGLATGLCLVILVATLSGTISCSRKSLGRQSAATIILNHEHDRYGAECDMTFLKRPQTESLKEISAKIGYQLGDSICSVSVEATGISLTSENTRDVVFTETTTYDVKKVAALSEFVEGLFARLSQLHASANPDQTDSFATEIVDPANQEKYYLDDRLTSKRAAEDFAKTAKMTIHHVWDNLPPGLARLEGAKDAPRVQTNRVAHLQLFDDGWRLLSVSPPPEPAVDPAGLSPVVTRRIKKGAERFARELEESDRVINEYLQRR